MDAARLAQLPDNEVEQLIVSNIHPPARDPETWAAIIHPDNLARSRQLLVNVHERTASVLRRRKTERDAFRTECFARGEAGKADWFGTQAEYEATRRRGANFHQRVQRAISELGREQRNVNRAQSVEVAHGARETLRRLSVAVQRHQAAHARAGGIADQTDYELWQLLDRLTVPTGPDQTPTTLRTMLDIYWTDVTPVTAETAQRAEAEQMMRSGPQGRPGSFSGTPRARHAHNGKDLAS
ncbi:hypothetical protein OG402_41000 [Streptomyces anulatus]|uniref:hypothetical protein n=1 Tax=Streptomyces anulatus TaxID=1892 RepID=UPI0022558DBC|nr:hypothetical protein [Streptomyces anulatus]MCX4606807.1 hypothetical protein [Streptomyces anulatus]